MKRQLNVRILKKLYLYISNTDLTRNRTRGFCFLVYKSHQQSAIDVSGMGRILFYLNIESQRPLRESYVSTTASKAI